MSVVKIDESSKGGFACSRSIDLEIGCRNACKGCYGSKTSYMSDNYFSCIKSKDYDENKFRSSCKSTYKKGFRYVRFSKHSDSASSHLLENFKSVLKIAGEEGLKLVVVSKSLTYDEEVAKLMKQFGHILHMSLGMITKAPSDTERMTVANDYNKKTKTFVRIVADITKPCEYTWITRQKVIVTPMRFISKEIAAEYGVNLDNYKWVNGYWRPQTIHDSWKKFTNFCGEIGSEVKCCKCLVGDGSVQTI